VVLFGGSDVPATRSTARGGHGDRDRTATVERGHAAGAWLVVDIIELQQESKVLILVPRVATGRPLNRNPGIGIFQILEKRIWNFDL
jgi:hypothetical protein